MHISHDYVGYPVRPDIRQIILKNYIITYRVGSPEGNIFTTDALDTSPFYKDYLAYPVGPDNQRNIRYMHLSMSLYIGYTFNAHIHIIL